MTAPSALPGLDAIRDLCTDLGEDEHFGIRVSRARALVAAVEAAAEVEANVDTIEDPAWDDVAVPVNNGTLRRLRAALAPFRTRDVTADEVPQKLLDDVTGRNVCPACDGEQCVACSEREEAYDRWNNSTRMPPAPAVSHTDAVWQEGDDGGDGGLTLQAMQTAVNAAGLATAHLGDEVWDGGDR